MKISVKFIVLALIAVLFGCQKQSDNPSVESYVNQLKSNSYTSYELPVFQPSDIPALLKYRNDTMIISNFPRNAISSLWVHECRLGIYVLWTIESIRAVEISSKYLIGRFPSQDPVLALRSSPELKLVYDANSQFEAADAYFYWWHAVYIFSNKMKTDPLRDTDYEWK